MAVVKSSFSHILFLLFSRTLNTDTNAYFAGTKELNGAKQWRSSTVAVTLCSKNGKTREIVKTQPAEQGLTRVFEGDIYLWSSIGW